MALVQSPTFLGAYTWLPKIGSIEVSIMPFTSSYSKFWGPASAHTRTHNTRRQTAATSVSPSQRVNRSITFERTQRAGPAGAWQLAPAHAPPSRPQPQP